MDIYKNWLSENGVKFEEKDYGLTFKYQGGYFIIGNNSKDSQYFNIVMPGIFDFADNPEVPRIKVLEALNKINADYKVVKAVFDNEDCWLTT
ncbi:MAG: YbjN domain-containing protein [Muribaculaceae bacterium]|nr:YbjN domain-containing protein [Muribaculaceae bacterium]